MEIDARIPNDEASRIIDAAEATHLRTPYVAPKDSRLMRFLIGIEMEGLMVILIVIGLAIIVCGFKAFSGEVTNEVRTVRVRMMCDVKDCKGEMVDNGTSMVFSSIPPIVSYGHTCNICIKSTNAVPYTNMAIGPGWIFKGNRIVYIGSETLIVPLDGDRFTTNINGTVFEVRIINQ